MGGGVAPGCSAPKAPGQSAPARAPAKDAGLAPSLRCRSLCPTARRCDPLPSSQASGARPPTGQRRTLSQPQDTCQAQAAAWKNSAGFGGRGPRAHPAKAIQTIWEGSASPFTGPSLMRERLRAGKRGQQHQAGPAAAEPGGNDRNALVLLKRGSAWAGARMSIELKRSRREQTDRQNGAPTLAARANALDRGRPCRRRYG